MRTIILILSFVLLTNLNLFGNDYKQMQEEWSKVETYDQMVKFRYTYKPSKNYKSDTDMDVYGTIFLEAKKSSRREEYIQDKIKNYKKQNQQPKFKSTYLDFTIIQEENIS
jgi:hypothetical protein